MDDRKPLLCLDFDGVLHSYTTPWQGRAIIPDPPVPGALAWMLRAAYHWDIAVFSARSVPTTGRERSGVQAMRIWMQRWLFEEGHMDRHQAHSFVQTRLQWPVHKPSADLIIDDRALRFEGDWGAFDPQELLKLQPWNHHLRHPPADEGSGS